MDEAAISEVCKNLQEDRFPQEFLADYEAIECLGHNEQGETLLVKKQGCDAYYVAKCYDKVAFQPQVVELELLGGIRHQGLPSYIDQYQNEGMLCIIREYIEGKTLDQLALEKRFTEEQVVEIGKELCDIVAYLHGHQPPIIHRDIKPQNIIMNSEGRLYIIDFGISRFYNQEAHNDTSYYGTRGFAAPEQYGFSQTDCRSDIFSFGEVLGWLLTGGTDRDTVSSEIKNRSLRHILLKCTEFSPEKRYPSAKHLKEALCRVNGKRRQSMIRRICLFMLCGLCLVVGFVIGRYTDIITLGSADLRVQFEEPLIEKAVRLALGKQEDSEVTEDELLEIKEIYIFGNKVAANLDEFNKLVGQWAGKDGSIQNGGIRSLQDISRLKNLRVLDIALQNIIDVSPLSSLNQLEEIEMKHNPITDVSPLNGLLALRRLYLYDTRVSDLSVLSDCPRLDNLVVGRTDIKTLDAFTGLEKLYCLHAQEITLDTLSGIENFPYLQELSVYSIADGNLTPLFSLPQLKKVSLDAVMKEAVDKIAGEARFEIIYME